MACPRSDPKTGPFPLSKWAALAAVSTLTLFVGLSAPAAPSAKERAAEVRITLTAAGDVMFGRQVGRKLRPFGYQKPFRFVRHFFSGRDIAMCNLETPIVARRIFWMRPSRLLFRAKPAAATLLKKGGFTLVTTANNHSHDQKDRGVVETLTHLRSASLATAGTGPTVREAWKPYTYEKNGVKVAVLAVTRLVNYGNRRRHGFVAHVPRRRVKRDLPPKIRALKPNADFVVVVLHWGEEYQHGVIGREKHLVRLIAEAGADLFIGHHPHVLRGIQRIGKMVAFYSLGNFMFDSARNERAESGIATAEFTKKGNVRALTSAGFIPINIGRDHLPRPATGRKAQQILQKIVRYSRRFRKTTRLSIRNDRLKVLLD